MSDIKPCHCQVGLSGIYDLDAKCICDVAPQSHDSVEIDDDLRRKDRADERMWGY
jgi:hypothetical protein